MPRKLQYPARRVIALTEVADVDLMKLAHKRDTTPAELARYYVEEGIRRDRKALLRPAVIK
jgi:hypothetical protein